MVVLSLNAAPFSNSHSQSAVRKHQRAPRARFFSHSHQFSCVREETCALWKVHRFTYLPATQDYQDLGI